MGETPTPSILYAMAAQPNPARTRFLSPGHYIEGQITEVLIEAAPFHCRIRITPSNPDIIAVEGRYSDNELSLSKLRRNLVYLKYKIDTKEDILAALESLEGRLCTFRIDQSGWISWIQKLLPIPMSEPEPPTVRVVPPLVEIYFVRVKRKRSIFYMQDPTGKTVGYAVGPTESHTAHPHGWVLYLNSEEEAEAVLAKRRGN